jgi:hypothetical protein
MLEIVGLGSEIFFHGERHRFGRSRQQADTKSCGYDAAKKAPQRRAAIDCIHYCSPCRDVPLLVARVRSA